LQIDLDQVCATLWRTIGEGWKARMNRRSELRLKSPNGVHYCHCPEKALFVYLGGSPDVFAGYGDVISVIATKLRQHPVTALGVAISADGCYLNKFIGRRTVKPNLLRRRIFASCGLDPAKA